MNAVRALTARHLEIVAQLGAMPRSVIASHFNIRTKTVDWHIKRTKDKLGMPYCTDAMLVARLMSDKSVRVMVPVPVEQFEVA